MMYMLYPSNTEIGFFDFVLIGVPGIAGKDDLSLQHNAKRMGRFQSPVRILLDDDHGGAEIAIDTSDPFIKILDDCRRKPQRDFIKNQKIRMIH